MELPTKIKDRTDNTLYMVKGETRLWRTGRLLCIHNKRPNRCKECDKEKYQLQREREIKGRIKNKEKYNEYSKKYYKENKEELKAESKIYCRKWRNENQYKIFYNRCLSTGFKHTEEQFKEIFKRRQESTECELCYSKYTLEKNKCCEHHHNSGSFRCICCNKCNTQLMLGDRNKERVLLELHRYFINNNIN